MELLYLYALASVTGVASHVLYFIHGEHHLNAPVILRVYLFLAAFPYAAAWCMGSHVPLGMITTRIFLFQVIYVGSLLSSIIVYRAFFHRTRHFPGPKLAAVSKFYHMFNATDSQQHLFLDRLHAKYGDFVRTGPNEITIFHPDAIEPIHGSTSRCTKAEWYDNLIPILAVVTTRSREEHDWRRRIWDHGYSIKALREHEDAILAHAHKVEAAIDERIGQTIDATKWFEYYGFDVMGVVQYNQSFGMLDSGASHWVLDVFKGGTVILGYMTSTPWLIHIVHSIPIIGNGMAKYKAWATESIIRRSKVF